MGSIESNLQENRVFEPAADVVKNAAVSGMQAYQALVALRQAAAEVVLTTYEA